MTRRLKARDVIQLAEENAVLVAQALERARKDCDSAIGSSGGGGERKTKWAAATSDRVLALAYGVEKDPVRAKLHSMIHHLNAVARDARELCALPVEDAEKLTTVPGSGYCANPHCQRFCAGGPDRLRSGRCDKCRTHRRRHGEEWRPKRELEEAG